MSAAAGAAEGTAGKCAGAEGGPGRADPPGQRAADPGGGRNR